MSLKERSHDKSETRGRQREHNDLYALVQQRKAENVEQLGKEKEGEKDDKKRVKWSNKHGGMW